ncbi:unnamed protein product [Fusarium equiseti]|uniref:Uncharacterized protein n=1 Tax=Fusarium equiseti TaxID=61235 RepID=A0A8J2NEK3_FUSEQ|nr:unnamed protein product [Fusarium equiseti]
MEESALNLRPPVQPDRGRPIDLSEPLSHESDHADESSQPPRGRGPRDHNESINRIDDSSRSPKSLEPRDHRGYDEDSSESEDGFETLIRAVIARFTDVAHDRQPRTPIRAHHQLVTEEKQKLGEWLRRSTRATDPVIHATTEDFRSYLNKIFTG